MLIATNLGLILIIGIIAYWWANQGLFSALLHLVCVITAGAVALGIWEPLVVGFLLNGGGFDGFAWGLTLVVTFVVVLLILRVIADKLIRANVALPRWANMGLGFPLGIASSILTIGILLIGMGFTQSSSEIFGYRGYGRDARDGKIVKYNEGLWVPAHFWTAEFYSWLSVTSMWTPNSMAHNQPLLHQQAALMRDTYNDGKGSITMPPNGANVDAALWTQGGSEAAVSVSFNASAMDFGEQLTVSASQVRLISTASGTTKARAVHPFRWVQDGLIYEFDNVSHYATSTPGQEATSATFLFDLPPGFTPGAIQIKNIRMPLRGFEPMPDDLSVLGGSAARLTKLPEITSDTPLMGSEDIKVSNDIRPLRVGVNGVPGTMKVNEDRYFVEGDATWSGKPSQVSRALSIQGVAEPRGTRIIKVDVSRGTPSDLFSKSLRGAVAEDAKVALIDSNGNMYSPLGYIQEMGGGKIRIVLAPGRYVRELSELPFLPTSGVERLRLYFRVTVGAQIVALMVDDKVISGTDLIVPP